jgi:hypothetical protein
VGGSCRAEQAVGRGRDPACIPRVLLRERAGERLVLPGTVGAGLVRWAWHLADIWTPWNPFLRAGAGERVSSAQLIWVLPVTVCAPLGSHGELVEDACAGVSLRVTIKTIPPRVVVQAAARAVSGRNSPCY